MPEALLIQVDEALTSRLTQSLKDLPESLAVHTWDDPEAAAEHIAAAAEEVAVVMIGAENPEPIRLAQRVHAIDRDIAILLLTGGETQGELHKALQFTPYVGEDITCLSPDDTEAFCVALLDAARRRQQRQPTAQASPKLSRPPRDAVGLPPSAGPFDQLLDHAPLGIITVNADGDVYGWNRHAQKLLNRSERDVLGQPLSRLFAMPEREQVQAYLARAVQGGDLPPTTFDRSLAKGQSQQLELCAMAVNTGPPHTGALVLVQDVTAREQARLERDRIEAALRQQRQWFQAVVLSIGDAVIATDKDGHITLMNNVAEQLTGWPANEAAGLDSTKVFRIVDEQTHEPVESPVECVLRDGQASGLANHSRLIARDGTAIPIDDSGAPIRDEQGNLIGTVLVFRDIRERRTTEQALRESEQRFRAIFEHAAAGIALLTSAGRITQVNERFCQLVGYSRDELRAMDDPVAHLTHPDDLEADRTQFRAVLAGEIFSYQMEKRYIRKDGQIAWVNLGVSVLRGERGQIQHLIGVVEDITKRKTVETALKGNEQRLRLILDSLTDYAIFTLDLEGRVTSWNNGARRLLGYDESEIIGQSAAIIFPSNEPRAEMAERERRTAEQTGQARDERWHERKDGSRFWANGVLSALGETDKGPQGFVKILRDQTQAKLASQQLEARARQQAAVARFGQTALAEPTLARLMNDGAELVTQTLNLPLAAVLRLLPEQNVFELSAGVGWDANLLDTLRVDGGGTASQAGYTLHTGAPVIVEDLTRETRFTPAAVMRQYGVVSAISVIIVGPDGNPWGVLAGHARERRKFTDDDVNFLQALANILATAIWRNRTEQRLRELNQTLEQRVAERTAEAEHRAAQLSALTSELTRTEQRERRRLAEVLHDHLQQMLVASKLQLGEAIKDVQDEGVIRTLQRANELLERSINESRSLTVELSPPVLYDAGLVPGLEWLGRWMKQQHGLSVRLEASNKADPESEDLRVLLFQAARELLFNVVKHAQVQEAEITLQRSDEQQIELSVRDRGRGFEPHEVERSRHERSGFGLFSIRERLAWLGGEFKLTSTPGEGTCATIILPDKSGPDTDATDTRTLASDGRTAATAASTVAGRAGPIRVLLADDHEIVRGGLVGVLSAQPDIQIVGEADDGQAAVELTRVLRPDVVVLDITMPRMNGIEAARLITREFPDIRVIGLSVHESEDMSDAMHKAGATAYLNKAGPSHRILAAIRNQAA